MVSAGGLRVCIYPGAKTKVKDLLYSYFPSHYTYIEPFAGSYVVFLNKKLSPIEIINDIETPTVNEIMSQLDWNWLCTGIPSERFHGDLHFENILLEERDGYSFFKFTFLDWRQEFGGLLEYGDIYYDLAKLNHGIIISHEIIDKELFSHSISNDVVKFDFLRKNVSVELERMFEKFIIEEGYEYRKVQYLTYLIFLNIASLHHYPYGLLLFHLGKLGLWKLLQEDKAKENKQNEN